MQFTFQKYLAQYEIPLLSLVDFLKHPPCLDLLNQVSVPSRGSTKTPRIRPKELRLNHKKTKTQAQKNKTRKSGKISIHYYLNKQNL